MATKPRYTKADRRPTWVSLVLDCLVTTDDFMNVEQLRLCTKAPRNSQITAALAHLRGHGAVDSVQSAGHLWWFATPEEDKRSRVVSERVVEPKGNRGTRKGRTTKVKQPKGDELAYDPIRGTK